MFHLLPLIKKIYLYLPILELSFDPVKLQEWLSSVESPFVGAMLRTHMTDLSEELSPHLDHDKKEHFKAAIQSLKKYMDPLPILIFLSQYAHLGPLLYSVIKSLRHVNFIYLSRSKPLETADTQTIKTVDVGKARTGETVSDTENAKIRATIDNNVDMDSKKKFLLVAKMREYLLVANSSEIPDWPRSDSSIESDNNLMQLFEEFDDNLSMNDNNSSPRFPPGLILPIRSFRKKLSRAMTIALDIRDKMIAVNYIFLDAIANSGPSLFFEDFEIWLEELGNILLEFVLKAREEAKINMSSVAFFRQEMKRYEHSLCPIINNVISQYNTF